MDALIATYLAYAVAAITLTGVLAKTLHKNGRLFLREVFEDNDQIATAVNTLLVVGFYMLNLGYAFLIFRAPAATTNLAAVENLVMKLGALLLSLGVMHFVNMAVFWRIRRSANDAQRVPATFTAMVPPPPLTNDYLAPQPN